MVKKTTGKGRPEKSTQNKTNENALIVAEYQADWNKFAREILNVKLDTEQQKILSVVQTDRKVAVSSGNARGKDYVAAVAALCFLYLNSPSKVVCTAPTGRQVTAIMMAEISKIHIQARLPLGGELLASMIKFANEPDWFLIGFKAGDKATEDWSGFHSPNIMVIITEATGIEQETFNAVEGILTGNSRLLLVFNPNRITGHAYKAMRSPEYTKFTLNSLQAPNVTSKKIIYPGQVDWQWINERVKPGWVTEISREEVDSTKHDFQWEGKWYRPGNLFLIKVMGQFPTESADTLIPFSWLEAANKRWNQMQGQPVPAAMLRMGVDVAGMGKDNTVFVPRRDRYIDGFEVIPMPPVAAEIHMKTAGEIKNRIAGGGLAFIDTIGEGAGVYSRLVEQQVQGAVSVKGSESADGLTDMTGARTFANMRTYLYWAFRDALDPAFGFNLAIPPCPELEEEVSVIHYTTKSNGKIIIQDGDGIKKALGRSPDWIDSLKNTFYPVQVQSSEADDEILIETEGYYV